MNMQNLLAQAQKMKKDIEKKQEEVNSMIFEGNSEAVNISMNGKREIIIVKINRDIIKDSEDLDALEDMIQIALKDVLLKVKNETDKMLGQYGSGLNGLI